MVFLVDPSVAGGPQWVVGPCCLHKCKCFWSIPIYFVNCSVPGESQCSWCIQVSLMNLCDPGRLLCSWWTYVPPRTLVSQWILVILAYLCAHEEPHYPGRHQCPRWIKMSLEDLGFLEDCDVPGESWYPLQFQMSFENHRVPEWFWSSC